VQDGVTGEQDSRNEIPEDAHAQLVDSALLGERSHEKLGTLLLILIEA
jgi:hypothetical protein